MGKHTDETASLLKGAFILTIAAMVTKVLSAVYRVPFQNIVGDVGFYIYQQIYPFYGMAIVLCTVGFPVIISKLYAEYKEIGDQEAVSTLVDAAFIVLFTVGVLTFSCLFFGAEMIAVVMKDAQLVPLIKAVSYVFLFMPLIALIRGIYQGRGDMIPTAVSQVGEQFIRVTSILIFSFILVEKGYSLYAAGEGAVYGSIAGLLMSVCILVLFVVNKKDKHTFFTNKNTVLLKKFIKVLFVQGTAVCLSGMLIIFIQLADSFNLYALLVSSGVEETVAKGMKGIYDRGQPLIQLGIIVATSISLAIIPFISSAKARNDVQLLTDKTRLALQLSIVVGVGASAGLWCIIEPTNIMLFENNAGSDVLAVLALMIAFSSAIMTIIAILQGLGMMIFPAIVVLCGALMKYLLNMLLVPSLGTIGGAFASVMTLMIVLAVLAMKLSYQVKFVVFSSRFIFTLSLATILLVVLLSQYLEVTNFLYAVMDSERIAAAIQALSAVIIGGFIYMMVILRGGIFRMEEIGMLPFGSKLILFLPKKYRLGDSK